MNRSGKTASFILDTSFILALLNPLDKMHKKAKDHLFSIEGETVRFVIPLICVIETLVKNPYPKEYIFLLSDLIGNRDFELTSTKDLEYISCLPLKKRSLLKADDCCILAICSRIKAQLLTFDKSY